MSRAHAVQSPLDAPSVEVGTEPRVLPSESVGEPLRPARLGIGRGEGDQAGVALRLGHDLLDEVVGTLVELQRLGHSRGQRGLLGEGEIGGRLAFGIDYATPEARVELVLAYQHTGGCLVNRFLQNRVGDCSARGQNDTEQDQPLLATEGAYAAAQISAGVDWMLWQRHIRSIGRPEPSLSRVEESPASFASSSVAQTNGQLFDRTPVHSGVERAAILIEPVETAENALLSPRKLPESCPSPSRCPRRPDVRCRRHLAGWHVRRAGEAGLHGEQLSVRSGSELRLEAAQACPRLPDLNPPGLAPRGTPLRPAASRPPRPATGVPPRPEVSPGITLCSRPPQGAAHSRTRQHARSGA